MAEFRRMLLLVTVVNTYAGLLSVSGAGITLKYVCPGDSVQVFQNIDFDRCHSLITLKINGRKDTHIGSWSIQNCTLHATLAKEYTDRVFFDQNKGTITIHNLHHFDHGKYVVISRKNTLPSIQETQIHVMVAPSKDCKPVIMRYEDKLVARLTYDVCGTPVATLYWKSNGSVSHTNEPILKITPGTESRTYYACIQGPAVQCAKSRMPLDNCSPFILEGDTTQTKSSESSNTVVNSVVIIVLGTQLILTIVVIVILILNRRKRNPEKRQRYNKSEQSALMQDLQDTKYSTSVNESNYPEESQRYNKSKQSDPEKRQRYKTSKLLDPTSRPEEASTQHEKIEPYVDCCRFCEQGKKAMFVLSCEHFGRQYVPACFPCGNSYQPCRLCRTLNINKIFA